MGPINRAFKAKAKLDYEEPQFYLSEAIAAMLVSHPIFQKKPLTSLLILESRVPPM